MSQPDDEFLPGFFLSYTVTKSANPEATEKLIAAIKQELRRRDFRILDPLTDVGNASVSEKVRDALDASDCAIVDITTASPNVMFETGYSQALFKPCVLFLDRDAHNNAGRRELLTEYLSFLKQNASRPLPADLGDIEYIHYSSEDLDSNSPMWRKQFREVLDSLQKRSLAPSALALNRRTRGLMQLARDVLMEYNNNHPFQWMVSGWYSQLRAQYRSTGHSVFQVDALFYPQCLRFLRQLGIPRIRAIADLSEAGDSETLWQHTPDPKMTSVRERIFLAPREWYFNDTKTQKLEVILREQGNFYDVRFGHVDRLQTEAHPLGPTAKGNHLLLIEPDLVGGYVEIDGRPMLHVECNPVLYQKAEDYYNRVSRLTSKFEHGWTSLEVRQQWREKERIGVWDKNWTDTRRDQHYYDRYDDHIRCWIMDYDQLILLCAKTVQTHMAQLFQHSRGLRILEIGFGTGALTDHLLKWIVNLNLAFRELGSDRPIERYVGLDPASQMKEEFQRRNPKWSADNMNSFISQRFGGGRVQSLGSEQFHLVCGSLVLHDLIGPSRDSNLTTVFSEIASVLKPDGVAVFADIFPDAEESKRRREIDEWTKWMRRTGMKERHLQLFLEGNPEMLEAPTVEEIKAVALKSGFTVAEFQQVNPRQDNPFQVFVCWKGSAQGSPQQKKRRRRSGTG